MRQVIKHGKHYKEKDYKEKADYITRVRCPECNLKIHCDLDYPRLLVCKCGCEFRFEDEDVEILTNVMSKF